MTIFASSRRCYLVINRDDRTGNLEIQIDDLHNKNNGVLALDKRAKLIEALRFLRDNPGESNQDTFLIDLVEPANAKLMLRNDFGEQRCFDGEVDVYFGMVISEMYTADIWLPHSLVTKEILPKLQEMHGG